MDISKYQYLWQEEKSDWALVDSPYGYGIINIRTHMMLVLNNHELERALIKKWKKPETVNMPLSQMLLRQMKAIRSRSYGMDFPIFVPLG